jgi:transcriptional regulator with XRE-family HTH domain
VSLLACFGWTIRYFFVAVKTLNKCARYQLAPFLLTDCREHLDVVLYSPAPWGIVLITLATRTAGVQTLDVLANGHMPAKRRNSRETKTFGERLRAARRERRLTQAQLAKRLDSDASYVARLETGVIASPGLESLQRIAEALDLPVSALAGGEVGKGADVEKAITAYPGLDDEAKRSLIRMFRALDRDSRE